MTESSRSRAYPSISLPEAIAMLEKLVQGLGHGRHGRDAIAQALAYTNGGSGVAIRKIAAMVHFGLLHRQSGLYEPTSLGKSLPELRRDGDALPALRIAFLKPVLFKRVVDDYAPSGAIPRLLSHALSDYGITSNVRDEVARIFMESAQYARVLDSNGMFERTYLESLWGSPAALRTSDEVEKRDNETNRPEGEEETQVFRLSLTDGKVAKMWLPFKLNDQDLVILRAQFSLWEAQVQVNKPVQPLRWPHSRRERESS